jgi:hypothetical protein
MADWNAETEVAGVAVVAASSATSFFLVALVLVVFAFVVVVAYRLSLDAARCMIMTPPSFFSNRLAGAFFSRLDFKFRPPRT